jgi:hypothetical protein
MKTVQVHAGVELLDVFEPGTYVTVTYMDTKYRPEPRAWKAIRVYGEDTQATVVARIKRELRAEGYYDVYNFRGTPGQELTLFIHSDP